MAKGQQPIRPYIADKGTKPAYRQTFTTKGSPPSEESEVNTQIAGFRARKDAMHELDGNNSSIRGSTNTEEAFEKRPDYEEKEDHEGVKEVKATTHYKEE